MLDAFIIEKIRREREARRDGDGARSQRGRLRLPLERPGLLDAPLAHPPDSDAAEDRDGGAVIVDFTI